MYLVDTHAIIPLCVRPTLTIQSPVLIQQQLQLQQRSRLQEYKGNDSRGRCHILLANAHKSKRIKNTRKKNQNSSFRVKVIDFKDFNMQGEVKFLMLINVAHSTGVR